MRYKYPETSKKTRASYNMSPSGIYFFLVDQHAQHWESHLVKVKTFGFRGPFVIQILFMRHDARHRVNKKKRGHMFYAARRVLFSNCAIKIVGL